MTDQKIIDETIDVLAERVADVVYRKLRADVLMGDDMLVDEDELAQIMRRHPAAMKVWGKIGVGPQFVRPAGSKRRQYRIGAVKHYLSEVRAGPMHATPFLEAQAEIERKYGRLPGAE